MSESDKNESPNIEDEWLIRPCPVYDEEYRDCTTIAARFHQYFIHGQVSDCSQWKRDSDNCYRWKESNDKKSAEELIQSEKSRRKARLTPHYNNSVWKRRKSPPENWNTPLPQEIQQEYEASYLNLKSKEMKGEAPPTTDPRDYCVLM